MTTARLPTLSASISGRRPALPRLDLLAKLGGDLYRRRSGLRELYAVLVPGTVGVDAGPQHAGDSVPANLLSVKMFGEAEFWFALIKVITIIALIGTGGWMIATG